MLTDDSSLRTDSTDQTDQTNTTPESLGDPAPPPGPLDSAALDALAHTIDALHRDSPLDRDRAVGKLLIERIYGGDVALWRSRGKKDESLRNLAGRLKTGGIRLSGLSRAASLVEMEGRIGVPRGEHLNITHVRLLFGAPEEHQADLMRRADEGRWSIEVLKTEIAKVSSPKKSKGGRPPTPPFLRTIHQIEKLLGDVRALGGAEGIEKMGPVDIAKTQEAIGALERELAVVRERLGARVAEVHDSNPSTEFPADDFR